MVSSAELLADYQRRIAEAGPTVPDTRDSYEPLNIPGYYLIFQGDLPMLEGMARAWASPSGLIVMSQHRGDFLWVVVTTPRRLPTLEILQSVKELFFGANEAVVLMSKAGRDGTGKYSVSMYGK